MDMTALIADLDGIRIEDNDKIVQQKSRDFYWYSPVLKRQLDHVTGDLVVSPRTEDELIRVLRPATGMMSPSLPAAPAPAITARPCRCPAAWCSASPT
jgi:hypothetical protein